MTLKQRIRNGEPFFIDFVSLTMSEEKLAARAAENPKLCILLIVGSKGRSQLLIIKGVYHGSIRSKPF